MKKPFEVTDSFCVYPFMSLNIMPAGTAKPCCAYGAPLQDSGRPMSVYDHSVADIWNSKEMRALRRDLVAGKAVANCEYCYKQERLGLNSMWTDDTSRWSQGLFDFPNKRKLTAQSLKQQAIEHDFAMPLEPSWFDLDFGNLCNLKCRMCNSTYSSAIAADPVHVKWSPPSPEPARWKHKSLTIAPTPVLGVSYSGIRETLGDGDNTIAWLDDSATISIDNLPKGANRFLLQVSGQKPTNHKLQVSINSQIAYDGNLPDGTWIKIFDLPFDAQGAVEICLKGAVFLNHSLGRESGVGIEKIELLRDEVGPSSIAIGRMEGSRKWYNNQEFLETELFRLPEGIEKIRFIGGEPMLIREVRSAMRHLVDKGVAGNITLMMVTNGTVIDEEIVDLLGKFKRVILMFSVDGVGRVNDYIRFPSRWDVIEKNIKRLCQLPNAAPRLNMTIQTYNLLDVENLITFSAESGIEFGYHLLQWPYHLSAMTLPLSVRLEVAVRLRSIVMKNDLETIIENENRFDFRSTILQLADAISTESQTDDKLSREFMRFTNDLDKSRGQDILKSLPELYRIISDQMGGWSSDLQFAN